LRSSGQRRCFNFCAASRLRAQSAALGPAHLIDRLVHVLRDVKPVQHVQRPASVVHTDGWLGYQPLEGRGYRHKITFLKGNSKTASELMPRVLLAVALLKRWLLGTYQGGVSLEHLDAYLDEFAFRFNRRKSRSRGKLFYRLLQQAVAVDPLPYKSLVKCAAKPDF
jgi:transposase-like protein